MFEKVIEEFTASGKTFAFAESCTGGLLGKLVTDVAGASAVFLGSAVTYSNEAKTALLGVKPEIIEACGAVSPETAKAMAEGARKVFGADIALSVTGIAGPGGGSPEKPVGTVYMAIATERGTQIRHLTVGDGTAERSSIRSAVAEIAEYRLLIALEELK